MKQITVSDFIFSILVKHGVSHVFLLPGGGNMYLVDAVVRNPQITPIPMLHEQSVGVAAEAFSQYRNNIGVALVTTGPGATNAITACAAAWADSTPVFFISGQVKQSDDAEVLGLRQRGFQETPITDIVRKITKSAIKLSDTKNLSQVIMNLIESALGGRPGPVWLDVPLNLQSELIEEVLSENLQVLASPASQIGRDLDPAIFDEIIQDWKKSSRPLFLLGNGVRLAGAEDVANKLIEKTQTPALLTWKAMDLMDENHPLNAGRPGAIGQRWANFAQQSCDFLISVGARIDAGQSAYRIDNFARSAKKYVLDIDSSELLKFDSGTWVPIHSDAGFFLQQLFKKVQSIKFDNEFKDWQKQIYEWKIKFPMLQKRHELPIDGINVYYLMEALSSLLDTNDVFTPGSSGACSEISMQAFKVKAGQRVLNSEGLGPMGFGIPGAIGSCIASGGRPTYCVDGDGGFMMNVQDLGTVAIQQLPIKFFVLNNNGYGSIKSSQDNYFEGRRIGTDPSTGLGLPRLEIIAEAFGIDFCRIESHSELDAKLSFFKKSQKPVIVDIIVSENQKTEPRVASGIDENGKLFTYPMEDMSPLISLRELISELPIPLLPEIINRKRN
jgi:acetolactate synthase-1/2/3 large subunit